MAAVSSVDDLGRDYRAALLRYLPRRAEAAMTSGYELGRRAAGGDVGLLDIVQVHHRVLAELLADRPETDAADLVEAAGAFLCEVLSTFDMAHRALHDATRARSDG